MFALSSYGGCGGVQAYRQAAATNDGIFFRNSDLRMADIIDGTSNTLLFGERYHRDVEYDKNAGTLTKMPGWGFWAPSAGPAGLGDVMLGTLVPINYRHPVGVTVNNAMEDRRVNAMGSGHPGGCDVALADGSTRFVAQTIDFATFQGLSTRAKGESAGEF
jgi:hypothetical protein